MKEFSPKMDVTCGQASNVAASACRTVLAVLIGTVCVGLFWGCADYLRAFGTAQASLLFLDPGNAVGVAQSHRFEGFLAWVASGIDWYNTTFVSATRFGSGLGMMAGAAYGAYCARTSKAANRIVVGMIAGSVIQARLMLMLTSHPAWFLFALITGAITGAVSLYRFGLPAAVRPLPIRRLPVTQIVDAPPKTQPEG